MKAFVYSNLDLIGETNLQIGDESMGGLFGTFIPNEVYFEKIQKSVWEFWEKPAPDYDKWQPLRFNVQLGDGYFLHPIGGYTIDDSPEFPNEPKRIDMGGIGRNVIEDFFLSDPPKPFVEKPWDVITIGQKIAFENELRKELGNKTGSIFKLFQKTSEHPLLLYDCSALCKDIRSDDVLFSINHKKGLGKNSFAYVHLTWKAEKEYAPKFPWTDFYESFDKFRSMVMDRDKADWED